MALLLLGFIACALFLIYYLGTKNYGYWKKRGVPYEPPLPFVGNLLELVLLRKNQGTIVADIYQKFKGEPVVGMYNFDQPCLIVKDPELVQQVLVNGFQDFPNNELDVDPAVDPILGNNMFCQRGARWKRTRQVLSPGFTVSRVKATYGRITACADKLVDYIAHHPGEIQAKKMMTLYSSEVVASWGLGIDGHSFTAKEPILPKLGSAIFEPSPLRALTNTITFMCPLILRIFRVRFIPKDVPDFFNEAIAATIGHRKKTGESHPDYLQHFIDAQAKLETKTDDMVITDNDILAGMATFFIEGYETASMVTSFFLYHLAMNPDIQDRLREELKDIDVNSYESIQNWEYLNQCYLETSRMHVALGNMSKMCDRKCKLGNVEVEPGTTAIIPLLALHYDPQYWPQPHKFDPERFSPELKDSRPKGVFLPFGDGPRICIGSRLATTMVKTAVVKVLKSFQIEPSARTQPKFIQNPYAFNSNMKGGLYLSFKPVNGAK